MENTIKSKVSKPKPITGNHSQGDKRPGLKPYIHFYEVDGNDDSDRGEEE